MNINLVGVNICNLFGFLNHEINFNEEGVTIIHGPNGCGKTTVLKLIEAFYAFDVGKFSEISFDSITFRYDDNCSIKVKKRIEVVKRKLIGSEVRHIDEVAFFSDLELDFFYMNNEVIVDKSTINIQKIHNADEELSRFFNLKKIEEELGLIRTDDFQWIDIQSSQSLDIYQVMNMLKKNKRYSRNEFSKSNIPDWCFKYTDSSKLHLIQTQRLLKINPYRLPRGEDRSVSEAIEAYSDEIRDKILEKFQESAKFSQSKFRTFPERLLSFKSVEIYSEGKIRDKYNNLEHKIQNLMDSGILEKEENLTLPDKEFDETEKKVLTLYVDDIESKLSKYDSFYERVNLFLTIISKKLRSKTLKVNQRNGFFIETSQGEGGALKPKELSSGEQHEIVLFYELIFKFEDASLFLIDEPEISLHVDWQRQFLDDISKVAEMAGHKFLIATHSPQIIGSRRDLAISLEGGILND